MRQLIIALVVACAPFVAGAQALHVTVHTIAGKPVPFAGVSLLTDTTGAGRASPLSSAGTTDSGEASFDRVPADARYVRVTRIGYAPVTLPLGDPRPARDHIDVVLEDFARARAREDSMGAERHRKRVAVARSRPRRWRCTLGDSIANAKARAAFLTFAGGDGRGMHKVANDYGMPTDEIAFTRIFVDPLSSAECVRFAEGLDRKTGGLVTDTVEVYRFGKAFYMPWYGGYEGGFANADGKILAVFIVPD